MDKKKKKGEKKRKNYNEIRKKKKKGKDDDDRERIEERSAYQFVETERKRVNIFRENSFNDNVFTY